MNNKKVRYKYIAKYVFELLNELNIIKYPIDVKEIISKLNQKGYNIEIDTYEQYLNFLNLKNKKRNLSLLSVKDIEKKFKSPDGATAKFPKTDLLIIFYNSSEPVEGRINWTLAHELGHILLKHYDLMELTLLQRRGIEEVKYRWLEREADWFARTLLCHPYVLDYYNVNTWDEIMSVCNVSYTAALYREKEISSKSFIINKPWDQYTLAQLYDFKKTCMTCKAYLNYQKGRYCPICGNKSLKWGDGKLKYIKYLRSTNEEGKLINCPNCHNDEPISGSYCHICGTQLVNECVRSYDESHDRYVGCDKILPSNARYCPDCGSPSNHFLNKLIPAWEEEYQENVRIISSDGIELDWEKIIENMGGPIRPIFKDTYIQPIGNNNYCIVFKNNTSYAMGNRSTILGQIANYIEINYCKEVQIKARLVTGRTSNNGYIEIPEEVEDEKLLPFN